MNVSHFLSSEVRKKNEIKELRKNYYNQCNL